jgi:DNA adenine methylase
MRRQRFEEMATVLQALKGRFILSLNDVQGVRETFAAFTLTEVKTTYSIAAKGVLPERAELLISNWELP